MEEARIPKNEQKQRTSLKVYIWNWHQITSAAFFCPAEVIGQQIQGVGTQTPHLNEEWQKVTLHGTICSPWCSHGESKEGRPRLWSLLFGAIYHSPLTYIGPEFIFTAMPNCKGEEGGVENMHGKSVFRLLFSFLYPPELGFSFPLIRCGWMYWSWNLPKACNLPQQSWKLLLCLQPGVWI